MKILYTHIYICAVWTSLSLSLDDQNHNRSNAFTSSYTTSITRRKAFVRRHPISVPRVYRGPSMMAVAGRARMHVCILWIMPGWDYGRCPLWCSNGRRRIVRAMSMDFHKVNVGGRWSRPARRNSPRAIVGRGVIAAPAGLCRATGGRAFTPRLRQRSVSRLFEQRASA